jgi:hypothetical protein
MHPSLLFFNPEGPAMPNSTIPLLYTNNVKRLKYFQDKRRQRLAEQRDKAYAPCTECLTAGFDPVLQRRNIFA